MNTPRSQENLVGSLISNRYRITGYISSGGMGSVFEAADTRLADKVVAVKVLHQGLIGDKDIVEVLLRRFEEEAKLSAILGGHSCIIQVTDYGVENAQPYLVMEFLGKPPRSNSLTNLLKEGALPPERVVSIGAQVCDALYYAHTINTTIGERRITGVVHRDIKPSNIFVIKEGGIGERIKVLDFGIAKAMSDMTIALGTNMGFIGTLSHASPEQLRGEVLDARSDIYAFGVVLYQMLTGNLPLSPKTETLPGWYQAHNYEAPISFESLSLPQQIPERLSKVVFACLAKDPDKRPANMQVLGDMLRDALKTEPLPSSLKPDVTPTAKSPIGAQMVIEPGRSLLEETPTVVTTPPRKQPPQPILPQPIPIENKWSWTWTFLSAVIVTATLLMACFFGLWVSGGFSSSEPTEQQSSVTFLSMFIGVFGGACLSAVLTKLKVTIEIIVGCAIAGMLIGLLVAAYTPEYALVSLVVLPLLSAFTGWFGALLGKFVKGKST
jgi:eukaryotic-like serine/threonine-protein kinase